MCVLSWQGNAIVMKKQIHLSIIAMKKLETRLSFRPYLHLRIAINHDANNLIGRDNKI